jgi:hypothetical protein
MIAPLTCSFDTIEALEQALSTLKAAHVPLEHLSLIIPEDKPPEPEAEPAHDPQVEGQPRTEHTVIVPMVDSLITGLVGGVFGVYAGVLSLIFPGVGPLNAIGPVSVVLGSAAAGAAIGGLASLLMKLGLSPSDAHRQEDLIKHGHMMLIVHPMNDQEWQVAHKALSSAGHLEIVEQPPVAR